MTTRRGTAALQSATRQGRRQGRGGRRKGGQEVGNSSWGKAEQASTTPCFSRPAHPPTHLPPKSPTHRGLGSAGRGRRARRRWRRARSRASSPCSSSACTVPRPCPTPRSSRSRSCTPPEAQQKCAGGRSSRVDGRGEGRRPSGGIRWPQLQARGGECRSTRGTHSSCSSAPPSCASRAARPPGRPCSARRRVR